jgi:hypothetical protein
VSLPDRAIGVFNHAGPGLIRTFDPENRTGQLRGAGGQRMTPTVISTLARAVLKIGYEMAWVNHGEEVLDPALDHVRDAILGRWQSGFLALDRVGPGAPERGHHVITTSTDEADGHRPDRVDPRHRVTPWPYPRSLLRHGVRPPVRP